MDFFLLCPNDHGYLEVKSKEVLIEYFWVHLSRDFVKEAEEDDVLLPSPCPLPNPKLGNRPLTHSVFCL